MEAGSEDYGRVNCRVTDCVNVIEIASGSGAFVDEPNELVHNRAFKSESSFRDSQASVRFGMARGKLEACSVTVEGL